LQPLFFGAIKTLCPTGFLPMKLRKIDFFNAQDWLVFAPGFSHNPTMDEKAL
jgi:hypothetical protein